MPDPKQTGLSDNSLGAIAYITVVPAIFFLAIAPYNKSSYVRFHAWQSTILTVIAVFVNFVLSYFPTANMLLKPFVFLSLSLVIWMLWSLVSLWCMISALNGKRLKLPLIGAWVEQQSNR
jgi:uncharacterized membrane protein